MSFRCPTPGRGIRWAAVSLSMLVLTGCLRLGGFGFFDDTDADADLDSEPGDADRDVQDTDPPDDADLDDADPDVEPDLEPDVDVDEDAPVTGPGWLAGFTGAGNAWIYRVTATGDDGVVLAGHSEGVVDLDPSDESEQLVEEGQFLVKLDSEGSYQWSLWFDTQEFFGIHEVLETGDGDVLFMVDFRGTLVIPSPAGGDRHVSNGGLDVAVARLDRNGVLLWSHAFGDSNAETGRDLTAGADGSVLFALNINGTVDLDPGPAEVTETGNNLDVMVQLDARGAYSWHRRSDVEIHCLEISEGFINSGGAFAGTVDLDPGPGVREVTAQGPRDMYFTELDRFGNLRGFFTFGAPGSGVVQEIARSGDGDVLLCGSFDGVVDFDGGPGVTPLTAEGLPDVFLASYRPSGALQWVVNYTSSGALLNCTDLAVTAGGSILTATHLAGTVDLDPGSGDDTRDIGSTSDAFVLAFRDNGTYLWGAAIDGDREVVAYDLALNPLRDHFYLTGTTRGRVDYDPGPLERFFVPPGGTAGFILRLPVGYGI